MTDPIALRAYQNALTGMVEACADLRAQGHDLNLIYRAWNRTVDTTEAFLPGFQAWLGDRVVEF